MEAEEKGRKILDAEVFMRGLRGQYIMAQALYYAIKHMESVPAPYTERSNIEDMKFIQENVFSRFPAEIFWDVDHLKKNLEKGAK
tara:strand:- start:1221 stop:1475 length:255 start_codon:yes stop_codon:yes gene_type:complete